MRAEAKDRPIPGKPCYDCETNVPMALVRAMEAEAIAAGRRPVVRCEVCELALERRPERRRA